MAEVPPRAVALEHPRGIAPQNAGRDALIAWLVVSGLVVALVRIDIKLPLIGHLGSALVAVLFLYVPVFYAWRRTEELEDYAFRAEPITRGLVIALAAVAIIIPTFALGFFAFYEIACNSETLSKLAPRELCKSYGGLTNLGLPDIYLTGDSRLSLEWMAVQFLVVALPEELFFRGFLLGLLERRFPPKRRWLGGGIGLALVLSALAFAVIHIPKDGDPRNLATFFPALLFGWMRSATGSILAPTITHGVANVLVRILERMLLR